eukprot:TRINITY_DN10045_c0_g1_i2.p1 TRINITY_DN10045_c0_g1~~TRINITY_DN10045_c0_g1_i2.p1  ORF type:complete len:610 (+),score=66.04 TRINITY_DN10045_c0_g1_i2:67-1830(+)
MMSLQQHSIGHDLHRRIGAEYWSVKREDLTQFRRLVALALASQQITPTDEDNFNPVDKRHGPNVYTVTEQFIKPRTAQAGGMSWALMLHPDGLKCDIFVTHAWQEGIFEFIDKVVGGWPFGGRHAWCCMLALPQNLHISSFIRSPQFSPFAVALRVASHLLVVSNTKSSIYSRLWCAYEAHIAYRSDTVILVTCAPIRKRVLKAVLMMLPTFSAGLGLGFVVKAICTDTDNAYVAVTTLKIAHFSAILSALMTVLATQVRWRISNYCGLFMFAYCWFPGHQLGQPVFYFLAEVIVPHATYGFNVFSVMLSCSFLAFWLMSEVDRVRFEAADEESKNLWRQYTGSIRDATCTLIEDRETILEDIGDGVDQVDEAIAVLLAAGFSTPNLREAYERNVDISGASRSRYAPLVFFLLVRISAEIYSWHSADGWLNRLPCTLSVLVWFVTYFALSLDRRVFAQAVTERIFALLFLFHIPFALCRQIETLQRLWKPVMTGSILLASALSCAGVHRISRLPGCGPALAQFLLVRSCPQLKGAFQKLVPRRQGSCLVALTSTTRRSCRRASPRTSDSSPSFSSSETEESEHQDPY